MSKVLVSETNLTAIADAIRTKKGSEDTYKPGEMAAAINSITTGGGGEGLPEEVLTVTGDCSHMFASPSWNWFITEYGDKITTKNIEKTYRMFYSNTTLDNIPFDIHCARGHNGNFNEMFSGCFNLLSIPKITHTTFKPKPDSTSSMFSNCTRLRYLPEDIEDYFDWSGMDTATSSSYSKLRLSMFVSCYSLRSIPMGFLNHGNPYSGYSSSIYSKAFVSCYSLDNLIGLPIPHYNANWGSNAFNQTFNACGRVKDLTFALTDNVLSWRNQVIDLTFHFGYLNNSFSVLDYNSGITADKEVKDSESYNRLKNDVDWFSTKIEYSRYNKTSAIKTINSLPTTTGNNIIKFEGEAGSLTDGGAINTLTEEEIAVATAKGWTVSLV
jgi:hypothetical protein